MHINEIKRNSFYQFPRWLLSEPYSRLGDKAKMMYMLLFDRRGLSVKNKWHDEDGNIYMYFTNEEFMKELNCSEPSIIKAKKELAEIGLLKEVRQGMNKPNRLYLLGAREFLGSELNKVKSRTKDFSAQDLKKVQGINTNNINTNISRLIEPDLEAPIKTTTDTLISIAEQEFGRLLSPFEIQDLSETAKETSFELIVEGIKETKFNGKTNIKYLNGILRNWRDNNITTVEQVRAKKGKSNPKPAKSNVPSWSNPDYKPAMKGMTREEFLADEE